MALVKFNTGIEDYTPVAFSSLVDKFFNDSFQAARANRFIPQVDVAETETEFEITMAIPGMKKEELKINLEEGRLSISGERKVENEQKGKNFHSREIQYGQFSRSFYLPDNVDIDKISAEYNHGLLKLSVPKDVKKALKKSIEIK